MEKDKVTPQDYALLNKLLEGCQIVSRDWKYLFVNEAIMSQGRQSWENLLGKTMMEAYPGIDETPMFARLREVMQTRVPVRMLNEFTYPDGSRGWFDLSIHPWPDGIMILSLDVTAQKRLEALEAKK